MIDSIFSFESIFRFESIFSSNGTFQTLQAIAIAATVLLPAGWLITLLLKQSSAAKRFTIWQTVFAGLLLMPIATIAFPKLNLGYNTPAIRVGSTLADTERPSSPLPWQRGSHEFVWNANEAGIPNGVDGTGESVTAQLSENRDTDDAVSPVPGTILNKSSIAEIASASDMPRAEATSLNWPAVVVIVWLAGFVCLSFRLLRSHATAMRIANRASELPSVFALGDLGHRRNEIRITPEVGGPVTVGILRPLVLLPVAANDWPAEQVRLVLAHELAHVDRHDVLWQLIASVTKAMYWFHPMIWVADTKMKLDRELACDDRVLSQGALPSEYSSLLIQMATALSSCQRVANRESGLLGVSMARKPIETRVASILAVSNKRSQSGPLFQALSLLSVGCLVLIIGVLRPFGTPLQAADTTTVESPIGTQEPFALPSQFKGRVLDEDGQPVVGANVELTLMQISDVPAASLKNRISALTPAMTNERGEYSIPTSGMSVDSKECHVGGFIKADGFPHYKCSFFIKDVTNQSQLEDVDMTAGRLLTGRVIAPADATEEPVNVVIRLTGDARISKNSFRWESAVIACDPDGRFQVDVPKVGRVELDATAENFAGVQVPVSQGRDELVVRLAKGTSVFGRLSDASGQPIADAVVNISGIMENDLSRLSNNPMFSPLRSSVKTDSEGRYELPPFVGRTRIFVSISGRERTKDSFFWAGQMPVIAPQIIEFDGSDSRLELNLSVGPTTKLSGTIRWKDGSPAENVQVRAYVMCGGSSVDVNKALTNQSGQYTVEVPASAEENSVGLMVSGSKDEQGNYKTAYPVTDVELLFQRAQSMSIKSIANDVLGLDWELREREVSTSTTKVERHKRTDADIILEELGSRNGLDRDGYCAALLKLESEYRGEFASILALRKVLDLTCDIWPEPTDNVFYSIALERLTEHYLSHKDVEFCAESVTGQIHNPEAIKFLQRLQAESPHEHVQAAATFFEFSHLAQQLRLYRVLEQGDGKAEQAGPDDLNARQIAIFDRIKQLDPKALRDEAGQLVETLNESYQTVRQSRLLGHIGTVVLDRYYPEDGETYAAIAKERLQGLDNMEIGTIVPEIDANDPHGNPFRLSDLRGKVVLVFFSSNWHHPRQRDFYRTFRDLRTKHEGKPFEILSVLVDSGVEFAREPVDDGNITWQAVWDEGEEILKEWNVQALPSDIFVIDRQGVLRGRFFDKSDVGLETLIEEMIGGSK